MKTTSVMFVLSLFAAVVVAGGVGASEFLLSPELPLPKEMTLFWEPWNPDQIMTQLTGDGVLLDYKNGEHWLIFQYANTTAATLYVLVLKQQCGWGIGPGRRVHLPLDCFNAKAVPPGDSRIEFPAIRHSHNWSRWHVDVLLIDQNRHILGNWRISGGLAGGYLLV